MERAFGQGMTDRKIVYLKSGFLIFAALIVILIALAYGINPAWFVATFLHGSMVDTNWAHLLRAVMGLYIFMGIFWLYAARHPDLRNTALLTTIVFAGVLVSGRILSLMTDGLPSPLLLFYLASEGVLIPIAIAIYRLPEPSLRA